MISDLFLTHSSSYFFLREHQVKAREARKGAIPTPEQKTYFGWSSAITNNGPKFHEFDEVRDLSSSFFTQIAMSFRALTDSLFCSPFFFYSLRVVV